MASDDSVLLPQDFPYVTVSSGCGMWPRIHSEGYDPWFFATDDESTRSAAEIGRFDLPAPHGTCYLGNVVDGNLAEVQPNQGTDREIQAELNNRRLSWLPLNAWCGRRIADFRSPHGPVPDVIAIPRQDARVWARAAHAAGFGGVLYRLKRDPSHRRGLALFGQSGQWEPPHGLPPSSPTAIPVAARNDWKWLVGLEEVGGLAAPAGS